MTRPAVLAIDGGNSKTDAILVSHDGRLLWSVRGPGFRPQADGLAAALSTLDGLVADVLADLAADPAADPAGGLPAGERGPAGPPVEHVSAYLAGADLPEEEDALQRAIAGRGWSRSTLVGNDTLALLRVGAPQGWGVAVVCGAGINCAGVGPDGRTTRFPALGRLTGDWGGGYFLGEEALWWAVRAEDGRGPQTALAGMVPAHFGLPRAVDVAIAVHTGRIAADRLDELAPVLFGTADGGDPVAVRLVSRLAEEVAVLGLTALGTLDLLDQPADVVLGGGVLARRNPMLLAEIERRYAAGAPQATLRVVTTPPVLGAALLGLDRLGRPNGAEERLRADFAARHELSPETA
jgi:N-acetylglucosamine kinase-like BadF-type ATPase